MSKKPSHFSLISLLKSLKNLVMICELCTAPKIWNLQTWRLVENRRHSCCLTPIYLEPVCRQAHSPNPPNPPLSAITSTRTGMSTRIMATVSSLRSSGFTFIIQLTTLPDFHHAYIVVAKDIFQSAEFLTLHIFCCLHACEWIRWSRPFGYQSNESIGGFILQ